MYFSKKQNYCQIFFAPHKVLGLIQATVLCGKPLILASLEKWLLSKNKLKKPKNCNFVYT